MCQVMGNDYNSAKKVNDSKNKRKSNNNKNNNDDDDDDGDKSLVTLAPNTRTLNTLLR